MEDLSKLRQDIDRIDRQIVELFEERMGVSRQVAEYKIANGKKVLDRARELEKLETLGNPVSYTHLTLPTIEPV